MILNVPHYKFFFYFEILIKKKNFHLYIYFQITTKSYPNAKQRLISDIENKRKYMKVTDFQFVWLET